MASLLRKLALPPHEYFFYVSVDLSSRSVSRQVFSALQSLTSVFGMGTGGPFALKTLTYVSYAHRKPNKEMKEEDETQVFKL